jgi:hypothetical protein
LGDFELYVGGREDDIGSVAEERPAIIVGANVGAPLSPFHRQALAREVFALKRGLSILRYRTPADVAALIAATCLALGVPIDTPQYAMLGEFQRLIAKALPRRLRKTLPELARQVASAPHAMFEWHRAATSSLDRMAAVAAGDVSWVLCGSPVRRGAAPVDAESKARAERLLSFVLSPTYLALRDHLGMGVR